jgi:hypothetical protein
MAEETEMSQNAVPESVPQAVPAVKPAAPTRDLDELLKRAENGDKGCLPQIRKFLADGEQGRYYREAYGSPAELL